MRRVENIIEALECLAYMKECTYSEERCPYYMGDEIMCDNSEIAKKALELITEKGAAAVTLTQCEKCGQPTAAGLPICPDCMKAASAPAADIEAAAQLRETLLPS